MKTATTTHSRACITPEQHHAILARNQAAEHSVPMFAKPGETQQAAGARLVRNIKRAAKAADRRAFPTFKPGMSTAQYVADYSARNGHQNLTPDAQFFATLNQAPATLYEGGAFDFEPVADVVEAVDAAPTLAQPNQSPRAPEPRAPRLARVAAAAAPAAPAPAAPQGRRHRPRLATYIPRRFFGQPAANQPRRWALAIVSSSCMRDRCAPPAGGTAPRDAVPASARLSVRSNAGQAPPPQMLASGTRRSAS